MNGISRCGSVLLAVFFMVFGLYSTALALEFQKSSKKWSGSLEMGTTVDGSCAFHLVGAYWLPEEVLTGRSGAFAARIEADLGLLDSRDTTIDAGFQPVLRYTYKAFQLRPYLDFGAGIHFLSRANIRGRQLGGAFQFSVLGGAGLCFGNSWEMGYRFFHISNADIHDNNDGRDEHLLVLTFHF